MKRATVVRMSMVGVAGIVIASFAVAADWPQWRGLNRAAKVTDFKAPSVWPAQLSEKWKVTVGEGDAAPSLVGDKLYIFSRQDANEIIRCLDAASGNELWQDKYEAQPATDPGGHAGPRASPTVAEGKVVTFGARGMLSCLDAATGKLLWRKDDFKSWPQFYTSSSPIVVDGLCIAQLGGGARGGGRRGEGRGPGDGAARGEGAPRGEGTGGGQGAPSGQGGIVAYDLTSGEEKWKWTEDLPSYASPVLMTIEGQKLVVALTAGKLVALGASDGKLAWETAVGGGGGRGGRGGPPGGGFGGGFGGGDRGERGGQRGEPGAQPGGEREAEKKAESTTQSEAAKKEEGATAQRAQEGQPQGAQQRGERGPERRGPGGFGAQGGGRGGRGGGGGGGRNYNASTPLVDGQTIYFAGTGIKAVKLEKDGDKVVAKELWNNTDPGMNVSFNSPVLKDGFLFGLTSNHQYFCVNAETGKTAWTSPRGQKAAGGRSGGPGYGSLVDAGSVLLAITSGSELVVIKPTDAEYTEIARIKVADSPVYAHLVVAGNRLFVKDRDAVSLLTID